MKNYISLQLQQEHHLVLHQLLIAVLGFASYPAHLLLLLASFLLRLLPVRPFLLNGRRSCFRTSKRLTIQHAPGNPG